MRSNPRYADKKKNSALLSTEFGQNLACRKLNLTLQQLTDIVGTYSKGKYKGQLKGKLIWTKIINGGWVHNLGVVSPGFTYGYHIVDAWSEQLIYGSDSSEIHALEIRQQRMQPIIDQEIEKRAKEQQETQESADKYYSLMRSLLGDEFTVEPQKDGEHPDQFSRRINSWVMDNLDKLQGIRQNN